MGERKTILEWCAMFDIVMKSADGFDPDPLLHEKRFTLQEFNKGIVSCTCMWRRDTWKRIDKLVKEVYGDVPENTNKDKAQANHSSQ